jgi:hypothetical protein
MVMANKHVSLAMDMHAKIEELLEEVLSMWSVPILYSESHRVKIASHGFNSILGHSEWVRCEEVASQ